MNASTKYETVIEADPDLPVVRITREFDGSAARVFEAWTNPELVVRWLGPRSIEMRIDEWDARTGGRYSYTAWRDGEQVAAFYGSFHEARPGERLVQTFTYTGVPDGVSLETVTFTDLGDGRCRTSSVSVVDTMEAREAMLNSGMDVGVIEGFQRLDELLAED